MLNSHFILKATGAEAILQVDVIQSLWSGYGEIVRVHLKGGEYDSVVVKHIQLPQEVVHPRGWNSNLGHQRKLTSYQVESVWYQRYAARCGKGCPVPECLGVDGENFSAHGQSTIVLTDLSQAGFSIVKRAIDVPEVKACIAWLANFHATFLGEPPEGLWPRGSYWHLETRPDELEALEEPTLKQAAPLIDHALRNAKYQTLIHGDAKLANFCFSSTVDRDASAVAAVDFQYPGAGVGVQDLAYFLGSCLSESQLVALESELLEYYFNSLLGVLNNSRSQSDLLALEAEWRSLYDVAWADFQRFLKGWSPGHWKLNAYSEQLAQRVIEQLL